MGTTTTTSPSCVSAPEISGTTTGHAAHAHLRASQQATRGTQPSRGILSGYVVHSSEREEESSDYLSSDEEEEEDAVRDSDSDYAVGPAPSGYTSDDVEDSEAEAEGGGGYRSDSPDAPPVVEEEEEEAPARKRSRKSPHPTKG